MYRTICRTERVTVVITKRMTVRSKEGDLRAGKEQMFIVGENLVIYVLRLPSFALR